VLIALAITDLFLGSTSLNWTEIFGNTSAAENSGSSVILFDIRIPKMLTAILAGAGLALSGLLMQTLFRNPLAGPYVLGINSGASFGVSILILGSTILPSGIARFLQHDIGISIAAMLGALSILFLMIWAAGRVGGNFTILILGLILGQILGALQSALTFAADAQSLRLFSLWGMGNFVQTDYQQIAILFAAVLLSFAGSLFLSYKLDIYLLGDKYALTENIKLQKFRKQIILISGILAGIITAFCGPVAFIGMAVPHLTRHLYKTHKHRILIPACMLAGALLALVCDILSQNVLQGQIIPINILTALIGGPVVVWVIMKQRRGYAT
jgi:iron complex transport system permease protein